MLSVESATYNVILYKLTRPSIEPTFYHTGGEQANHYPQLSQCTNAHLNITCKVKYTQEMMQYILYSSISDVKQQIERLAL